MVAHVAQQLDGWWGGVLDPFDGFGVLLAIVTIGLLAGVASTAGREAWVAVSGFVAGVMGGLIVAAAGFTPSAASTIVIGASLVGAALISVDPPRIGNAMPLISLAMGALAGITVGSDTAHHIDAEFIVGLLFTTAVVLACTSAAGSVVGRSMVARRTTAVLTSLVAVGMLLA
jgi:hydrogenase/urease accessory protein HupE